MLICMEESSWMTGQIFYVDGGASIMDTVFRWKYREPHEIPGARVQEGPEIKGMAPGEMDL